MNQEKKIFHVKNGYWIKTMGIFPPDGYDGGIFENSTWFNGKFGRSDKYYKLFSFINSIWIDGVFVEGYFENSIWKNGIFRSGVIEKSTWENGVCSNCDFFNSVWKNGTWKGGNFSSSIWETGIWEDGYWNSGEWKGGVWIVGWIRDDYRRGNYGPDWKWHQRDIALYVRSPIPPSEYFKR